MHRALGGTIPFGLAGVTGAYVLVTLCLGCGPAPPAATPTAATEGVSSPHVTLTWVVFEPEPDAESTRVELLVRGPSGERRFGLPRLPWVTEADQEPCAGRGSSSSTPPRRLTRLVVPHGGLEWFEVVETSPGRLAVQRDHQTDGACDGPCPQTTPQVLHTLEVPSDAVYETRFLLVDAKGGKPRPMRCPPREPPA